MNVYTFDPLTDKRWSDLVDKHARASVFHTAGWLDALQRSYGYTPIAYTTSAPSDCLDNAIVVCEIRSWLTGRRAVSLPFADHCDPLIDKPADGAAILSEMERSVATGRWRSVEFRPLSIGGAHGGFGEANAFAFHSLDLRPPIEDLFQRFHKDSIQRKIRRAEREGLRYELGSSAEHLEKFYGLLLLTRRRHHLPPQPIQWFRNLIECMGARLSIGLVSKDGRAIAGVVLLRHGDTMVYKYGASDASVHSLGAMPFAFWETIREAKSEGVGRLDLGRSDLDNPGLITFKDRLGATRSTLRYARYPPPSPGKRTQHWGAGIAKRVIARLPDRVFVTTGRLLYRHFG